MFLRLATRIWYDMECITVSFPLDGAYHTGSTTGTYPQRVSIEVMPIGLHKSPVGWPNGGVEITALMSLVL